MLMKFNVGKNALDTLPASALQSLRQLEELYLSHNFIETIATNALPGDPNIQCRLTIIS